MIRRADNLPGLEETLALLAAAGGFFCLMCGYYMLRPIREALALFKSKSLIDTLLQRGADVTGQWLYQLVSGVGLAGIAWLCAAICVGLLGATRSLGRGFETRQRADAPQLQQA